MNTLKRVQLDLSEQSMERLLLLKHKTDSASYAEVVRNALKLYEALIQKSESGNTFLIRDKDGKTSEYEIFLAA